MQPTRPELTSWTRARQRVASNGQRHQTSRELVAAMASAILLRGRPVTVVDFDDPRSAMAYLSAINAPADVVWTDLGFRDGPLGLQVLDLAAFRAPRPELFLVIGAAVTYHTLPAGTRVFDKADLGNPVSRIEAMVRVPPDRPR